MKLRILIGLAATTASFCPPSEAQTNGLTPGTVVSWGQQVIPNVQPGTRYKAIAAGRDYNLALKSDGTIVAWGSDVSGQTKVPAKLTGVIAIAAGGTFSLALMATAPPPTLSISLTRTNVLISWPAAAPGYRPEAAASLSPPVRWNPVTTSGNLFSNRYELPLPITNGVQFFRLINP